MKDGRSQRSTYGRRLIHEVLGLDYGHPGLWDGEALTFANLKLAQRRYADELVGWIGDDVQEVLEVGCGFGGLASQLAGHGLSVCGLTPDPYERRAFEARTGLPCHQAYFQKFEPDRKYDLVLMNLSCHNIPPVEMLAAVQKSAPGGALLIADYFLRDLAGVPEKHVGYEIDAFLATARDKDFELRRQSDFTDATLPTRQLRQRFVDRHITPAVDLFLEAGRRERPIITRAALWMVGGEIDKLRAKLRAPDPEHYAEHRRFMFYLFQVPSPEGDASSSGLPPSD